MGTADLEIPEPASEATESAVDFVVELGDQVSGLTERKMDAFVEILAGLAVSPDDLIGHQGLQQCPELVLENLVIGGQFDAGEVHSPRVTLSDRSVKSRLMWSALSQRLAPAQRTHHGRLMAVGITLLFMGISKL